MGEHWQICLEGMDKFYVLEPLVIQGLAFLQEHNLKMTCMEEEVALMPIQERLTSKARFVDRGCHSFIIKQTGEVLRANTEPDDLLPSLEDPVEEEQHQYSLRNAGGGHWSDYVRSNRWYSISC